MSEGKVTKVLVTGCAGLIGSNFCDYLVKTFPEMHVVGVDNLPKASCLAFS